MQILNWKFQHFAIHANKGENMEHAHELPEFLHFLEELIEEHSILRGVIFGFIHTLIPLVGFIKYIKQVRTNSNPSSSLVGTSKLVELPKLSD